MHEVLLYGPIWSQSSIQFINSVNEASESDGLRIRVNTPGGDVAYTLGMIAKFKEFTGSKEVVVDGQAYSGGFFFALYADKVVAWDTSRFLVHRAAYPSWMEEDLAPEIKAELIEQNSDLEAAFRSRIDVKKFEEIKGIKVKDIFSIDQRLDVFLNAKEAKQIGLIDKIYKMTPDKRKDIMSTTERMVASYPSFEIPEIKPDASNNVVQTTKINTLMTREELQAQHPALYASVLNAGVQQGIETERDRVGAWAAWSHVDPKAVKEGIESGKNINQTQLSEFAVKLASAKVVDNLNNEGADGNGAAVAATNPDNSGIETAAQKFEKQIMSNLKKD
jgi:ATP-dependent protease ClpP protease subunit